MAHSLTGQKIMDTEDPQPELKNNKLIIVYLAYV